MYAPELSTCGLTGRELGGSDGRGRGLIGVAGAAPGLVPHDEIS
jgi:hypothetical protein